jgi:Transcriptional regulator containing an amidase domain and an AraC-type DNA-binding HTH domain
MAQTISVVVPVYDGVTQLDFTGPHQFLSRTPDVQVRVASLDGRPVTADRLTFSNLEDLGAIAGCDVLLVPGGGGCLNAIEHDRFLEEIARLGATARYLTSVCTGSLILGAAGFLRGRRAACHWAGGNCFLSSAPSSTRAASCATAISCPAAASRQASISCSP